MQFRELGTTGISVSAICLGTMTWGEQNSEADGIAQMNEALEYGVTFWDTAEMYPVPPRAETYGATETIMGNWFKKTGRRNEIFLASKAAGPDERLTYVRDGLNRFDKAGLKAALDASLKRLQTDRIDLYQLHWPERTTNYFGQLGYQHVEEEWTSFEETLAALDELIRAGKIRFIGVSNETPWGVMRMLDLARVKGLPRIHSIQNPYSLLNRSFEVGLAEIAIRERCGLLAYSPLAMGALSGKYLGGAWPAQARFSLFPQFRRYRGEQSEAAVAAYVAVAKKYGIQPAQMALAYINSRPFVTANIIGATTLDQLRENIASIDIALPEGVEQEIEDVHRLYTYPCP
ncbi:MAG TPA: NADP(H)-dependent aldo-keto reductase [Dongiaceae bacterium]|jgi:aryl-alcohol dehydrogenase-like predicted oxidoreductase|nr:NADP(H)-dependent aldo-keto reductase [Dongiaceae bacterium]